LKSFNPAVPLLVYPKELEARICTAICTSMSTSSVVQQLKGGSHPRAHPWMSDNMNVMDTTAGCHPATKGMEFYLCYKMGEP
jgi:hypothetical protein